MKTYLVVGREEGTFFGEVGHEERSSKCDDDGEQSFNDEAAR